MPVVSIGKTPKQLSAETLDFHLLSAMEAGFTANGIVIVAISVQFNPYEDQTIPAPLFALHLLLWYLPASRLNS